MKTAHFALDKWLGYLWPFPKPWMANDDINAKFCTSILLIIQKMVSSVTKLIKQQKIINLESERSHKMMSLIQSVSYFHGLR